jgi:hypothetical protein
MIYTKDITKLSFDDIDRFVQLQIREGLKIDYKGDFPSDLAKLIVAFANTHGGIILIGVPANKETNEPEKITGIDLKEGIEERVISIAASNIAPMLIPEVKVIGFKSTTSLQQNDRAVVVIRVNESNAAPHQTWNNSIWIRVHNECKLADLITIEKLLEKRDRSGQVRAFEQNTLSEEAGNIAMYEFSPLTKQTYVYISIVPAYPTNAIEFSRVDDDFLTAQIMDFLGGDLPHIKPKLRGIEFRTGSTETLDYFSVNSKGSFLYVTPLPLEGNEGKLNVGSVALLLDKMVVVATKIYKKYSFSQKVSLHIELRGTRNRLLHVTSSRLGSNFKSTEGQIYIEFEGNLDSLRANNSKYLKDIYNKLLRAFGCSWDESIVSLNYISAVNPSSREG